MAKKKAKTLVLTFFKSDPDGTNFNKIYGRFKEIGLLEVGAVFEWHNDFGLDVLLGIDEIF
ncbi:hypothetical protein [Flavobacterium johnsoniae]|uniref:Uncharacterized protein n=1 Tax=Flavobacterium johnsoniae TaxID=986 RepID=A0A1J7BPB9_FLAJO|nr:hypothetical protein [Flavobacterium johnsoniae]OIV40547.1 hypothetical protein BKM63_16850 [Flavobacterium johnsoniae]